MNAVAPQASAFYDSLWKARLAGPEALQTALFESINPKLPEGRAQALGYIRIIDAVVKSPGWKPAEEELQAYQEFTPLPFDIKQEIRLMRRTQRLSSAAALGLTTAAVTMDNTRSLGSLVFFFAVSFVMTRWIAERSISKREEERREQIKTMCQWNSEWPDMAIYLLAGHASALQGNRAYETHFLARAALEVLPTTASDRPDSKTERERLSKMAKLRGSHFASHALWLARQRLGLVEKETDLSLWPYDAELVNRARKGNVAAIDAVDLACRESPSFRAAYQET